jgi:hypothetical protein
MFRRLPVITALTLAAATAAFAAPPAPASQPSSAPAPHQSFAVSIYCVVGTLGGTAQNPLNLSQLAQTWDTVSRQLKIDKVYIETVRDQTELSEDAIEPLKKFFTDRGVKVAGGMTLAKNNSGQFTTYDYATPEDRATIKRLGETAAKHFDEVILDDFFFFNTKSEADIAAKGNRSWSEYRVATMQEVSKKFLVDPVHAVNPNCKIIIKYPNWYEHFQASGFDLDREPFIFDGLYTGTETRDPLRTEQHLQPYESYQVIRYFENIRPGHNGGGWVDLNQYTYADRYAEQLWDTVFAKAPQVMLFNWSDLTRPITQGNRPWSNEKTSFNWDDLQHATANDPAPRGGRGGTSQSPAPSVARTAAYALADPDKIVHLLGKPIGIKSYRPPHGTGEDFLHNYLGMIGLPIDLYPTYPADASLLLLTADARTDPDLVNKIKTSLRAGHTIVITSGLLKALQGKGIDDICELELTGNHIPVSAFHGQGGTPITNADLQKPILFPEIQFMTNDAWYILAGLSSGTGYPLLISDRYAAGTLCVLTIPDAVGDLYNLPTPALSILRNTLSAGLPVSLSVNTAAGIALFEYDNNTFILQNFTDTAQPATMNITTPAQSLTNLLTKETLTPAPNPPARGRPALRTPPHTTFTTTLPSHSWAAFSITR